MEWYEQDRSQCYCIKEFMRGMKHLYAMSFYLLVAIQKELEECCSIIVVEAVAK